MKRFIKSNEEWILGALGLLLFGVILGMTMWTVGSISEDMGRALSSDAGVEDRVDFRIEDLRKMNLRGLSETGN